MSIVLIGSEGSMGKRYQAIFRYLGIKFQSFDAHHGLRLVTQAVSKAEGVVIASPTATHAQYIRALAPLRKPILCEKPVMKDLAELRECLAQLRDAGTPFRMMLQYSMLVQPNRIGRSFYNYFRHGSDGLIWDCLQVIALARGPCALKEESPVWSCMINGQRLNIAHMDAAYIAYIQKWLRDPSQDLEGIYAIHERVRAAEVEHGDASQRT